MLIGLLGPGNEYRRGMHLCRAYSRETSGEAKVGGDRGRDGRRRRDEDGEKWEGELSLAEADAEVGLDKAHGEPWRG